MGDGGAGFAKKWGILHTKKAFFNLYLIFRNTSHTLIYASYNDKEGILQVL